MASLLPVVLTGGRSARFGRDKLREPVGDGMLVDVPIRALRAALGGPVALAGACDPDVALRADLVIPDTTDGAGPVRGIIAALEHPLGHSGIFVLAGDLACVTAEVVRGICTLASEHPEAWAVLSETDRVEPCAGIYRPAALAALRSRALQGRRSLHDALPAQHVVRVPVEAALLKNVNEVGDLPGNH